MNYEVTEIAILLWKKLSKESPDFNFPTYLERFGLLKTNLDRVNFVYQEIEKYDAFPPFKKDEKVDLVSTLFRENGNIHYRRGENLEALNSYTCSILHAESKEVQALAYANRAAALSKLNMHKECLTDISRALENNYPKDLRPKLIARQKYAKTQKQTKSNNFEEIPTFSDSEKHPFIQSAKNCLKIVTNEQFGTHVVATRRIKIGEILVIEKPIAAKLPQAHLLYCHECFQLCCNMIPCNSCNRALYCSEICKNNAFNNYHKYECRLLLSLDSITDCKTRLVLKICFMMKKNFVDTSTSNGDQMYRSDRLNEIYNLKSHTEGRDQVNLYKRAAHVAVLIHFIKHHTTFLENGISEDELKDKMLQLLLITEINAVYITEFTTDGGFHPIGFAEGLYSFVGLFNHSCHNNVAYHFHGNSVVLRAQNTIIEGEQCFVNYSVAYSTFLKQSRQVFLLANKFFTCRCEACLYDWPRYEFMEDLQQLNPDILLVIVPSVKLTKNGDVELAKSLLLNVISHLEQLEGKIKLQLYPTREYSALKYSLNICFSVFGNKRRI